MSVIPSIRVQSPVRTNVSNCRETCVGLEIKATLCSRIVFPRLLNIRVCLRNRTESIILTEAMRFATEFSVIKMS